MTLDVVQISQDLQVYSIFLVKIICTVYSCFGYTLQSANSFMLCYDNMKDWSIRRLSRRFNHGRHGEGGGGGGYPVCITSLTTSILNPCGI